MMTVERTAGFITMEWVEYYELGVTNIQINIRLNYEMQIDLDSTT